MTILKKQIEEEINFIQNFYFLISDSCYLYLPLGTSFVFNFNSYFYTSMENTLDSIKILLKLNRISDAYNLTRKFFDDILVNIYIDIKCKENYQPEINNKVEDVDNWLREKYRIPKLIELLSTIKKSKYTCELYPHFRWNTDLKKIRNILDDTIHDNRYKYILLNCSKVRVDREKHFQNIIDIINQLFKIHIAFIFYTNPHFLISQEIRFEMEMNDHIINENEIDIAPFAQEAFDKFIRPDKELSDLIKKNCFLKID